MRGKAAIALMAAALLSACGSGGGNEGAGGGASKPPVAPARAAAHGIVLVTLEGWSAPGDATDPIPETLAAGAVRFADAMTVSPQVRPAVASALTGSGPDRLGVRDDFTTPLPAGAPYLPEILKETGRATAGFVANSLLAAGSGFDRGFEIYDAPKEFVFGPFRHLPPMRAAAECAANFETWLGSLPPDRPWFAWVHLGGTPRVIGRAASQKLDKTPPAQQIRAALEKIDAALSARGKPAATIVVGVSGRIDLDEGGTSGYFLVPEVLGVPFLYRGSSPEGTPAAGAGAWLPDAAAIVLREAGIERTLDDGRVPGEGDRMRRAWTWAGSLDFGWPMETAVRRGDVLAVGEGPSARAIAAYAWISGQRVEPVPQDLAAGLTERAGEAPARAARPEIPPDLAAELKKQGIAIPEAMASEPPSPRGTRIQAMPTIWKARKEAVDAMPRYAARDYDAARKIDAPNWRLGVEAGEILALMGVWKKANAQLEPALRHDPYSAAAWHWLGHVEYVQKSYPKAEAMLRLADFLAPSTPDVLYDLACMRSLRRDAAGADAYLREAWAAGFRSAQHIQNDPDLRDYRADPRFGRFMQEVVK